MGAVFGAGAHFGIVYVLDAHHQLLQMETTIGLPVALTLTWSRIRTNDPVLVAASVRERRLIWLSDRVALAREFPAAALALPYHFAVAASPICSGGTVWGGLILGWPTGGESRLTRRQLDVIDDSCARMGRLLRQASERARPLTPKPRPRILDPLRSHRRGPHAGLTALACLTPESTHRDWAGVPSHGAVQTLVVPSRTRHPRQAFRTLQFLRVRGRRPNLRAGGNV
jgi:hypothetical protein